MRNAVEKIDIKSLSHPQLLAWLAQHNIAPYRAKQILRWIYHRLAEDFNQMTDLSQDIRALLAQSFTIAGLERLKVLTAQDNTQKYLFKLEDGHSIESVLIRERNHYTLCISTQVGCAQGCRFCHTARGGLIRNLIHSEMVSQVCDIRKTLAGATPLTNIVFMGMGEPLANYRNLVDAIRILTDADTGLGFAKRRVTVSTAGVVPRLDQLGRETRVNLAVSLNAVDDRTRSLLMPINRKYPLKQLLEACRVYRLAPHRRITFEYILLKGINDRPEDAHRLAKMLQPVRAKINLIPFNAFEGSDYRPPPDDTIEDFQKILIQKNYTAIIRKSKGADIGAACGQLRGRWTASDS